MYSYRDAVESSGFGRNRRLTQAEDDPFFLQNSDHPSMILVTNSLTETNYLQWSTAIEIALGAKLKLGFVNGTISEPHEGDNYYLQWLRVDRMVRSWILNTILKDLAGSSLYSKSARALWVYLKDRFGDSHGPMIYKLQRELFRIAKGV